MKHTGLIKKWICLLMAGALLCTPSAVLFAQNENTPALFYGFESSEDAPALFGNAALVYDEDRGGNVLELDGADGSYAAFEQGFFDGRDEMTVTFDVLAKNNSGNYFTFCFGQNNEVYSYFRLRDTEVRGAITRWSYPNEHEVKAQHYYSNIWTHIALVYSGTSMRLYINGTLANENSNTEIRVSDLGTGLLSYLGKSLYDGDGYFRGCFDNFAVYNTALGADKIAALAAQELSAVPVLRYSFEEETVLPALFGNAKCAYDADRGSRVLSLDGTNGTYAAFEQGFFDGRERATVMFDVKPQQCSGNYFTFAVGQDSSKYNFFRIRGTELRNAITLDTYYNERETRANIDYSDAWVHVALVFDGTRCILYANGVKLAQNDNTGIRLSDLGTDLLAYLGKSMYDGDGYFRGCFDNVEVYDTAVDEALIQRRALAHLPLLISATVGEAEENIDAVAGTDSHTAVQTAINREQRTVTATVQRRQNIKSVPVRLFSVNSDCRFFVDGAPFASWGLLDMSQSHVLRIVCGEREESYTLQAATVANNPVLPGMYADPDIDFLDGKFWIYPTTDGTPGWGGTQFHAFSSVDMLHWQDEGVILDNKNKAPGVNAKGVAIAACAWSDGNAWAPAIEEKNGKYYFYFCGRIPDSLTSLYGEGMAIGVAWADDPAGPYTAADAPLLYPKMMADADFGYYGQVIDPSIYTEGGQSYILFGNGGAAMADLNADMVSVDVSSLRMIYGLDEFRESVAVFKRNGTYYFHWSCDDTGSENYHINYGTASSLKGSITNRGTLLQKQPDEGILATGHQSVLYLPQSDKCFIAYHRFYTPLSVGGNVGHRRETCIEEITFRGGGLAYATPSMEGAGAVDADGWPLEEEITYPTCTQDGYITAPDFVLTANEAPEVRAAGHCYMQSVTAPTCTEGGCTQYVCSVCGDTYRDSILPPTGHDLQVTPLEASAHFRIFCPVCGTDKTFRFADYLNAAAGDAHYDADIDLNGDGIINGRDLAYLKTQSE